MSASQSRPEAPLRLSVKDMVGKIYQLPAGIEVDSSLLGLVDFMKRFAHPLMAIGNDHAMTHYGAALSARRPHYVQELQSGRAPNDCGCEKEQGYRSASSQEEWCPTYCSLEW